MTSLEHAPPAANVQRVSETIVSPEAASKNVVKLRQVPTTLAVPAPAPPGAPPPEPGGGTAAAGRGGGGGGGGGPEQPPIARAEPGHRRADESRRQVHRVVVEPSPAPRETYRLVAYRIPALEPRSAGRALVFALSGRAEHGVGEHPRHSSAPPDQQPPRVARVEPPPGPPPGVQ